MRRPNAWFIPLVFALLETSLYGDGRRNEAPEVSSIYPMGGLPGTVVEVLVRGQNLQDVRGVWFDCSDLQGEVRIGSEGPSPSKKEEVTLKVRIGSGVRTGIHRLRLYSPFGVSGQLAFNVNSEPTDQETSAPHSTPSTAQSVKFPSIVNGRLAQAGELDFYRIEVSQGQELQVELLNGSALFEQAGGPFRRPELILHESSPSWFGTGRHKRVEGIDESECFPFPRGSVSFYCRARWVYRITGSGSHFLQVSANGAQGGPHFSYQVRIVESQPGKAKNPWWDYAFVHENSFTWREWDFREPLKADRLQKLKSRSLGGAKTESKPLSVVTEHRSNDTPGDALVIQTPTILEGQIEAPGDRDYFRFSSKVGERLVFELETPQRAPHYFNAKIAVLNADGEELLSNIYRRVGGDGDDWLKSIQRRTIFDAPKEGDYWLEVRDMTNQRGGESCVYRILVRPPIPHVGGVTARTLGFHGSEPGVDRLNLAPGEVRRLDVISDLEEGFNGEVAISVENLPEGTQILSGAATTERLSSEPGRVDESRGAVDKERYLPTRVLTTMLLVANPDAPPTPTPRFIRLVARPVMGGVMGQPFRAQELALMVTDPGEAARDAKLATSLGAKQTAE